MSESVKSLWLFVLVMFESFVAVVNPCTDQSSTSGVDDLNSLLCIYRGPNSKSYWNETKILAAVVKPELLANTSDVASVINVVVGMLFAMSS